MIKSFIYLDEYKMYSLSSQIFEGVTEYLISTHRDEKEDSEEQKGPFASGRILADILKKSSETTEKKYLHDYSYTLFEKYLLQEDKVLVVNNDTDEDIEDKIPRYSFIRVAGKAIFNDIESIVKTIENLNELGEALTYAKVYPSLAGAKMRLEQQANNTKDRNQKSRIQYGEKSLDELVKQQAKTEGLYYEPKLLKSIGYLLSYGFQDQLQLQISLSNRIFSSDLNRISLREKEASLIRKYSRKTERGFVVFGIVTQCRNKEILDVNESDNKQIVLKEALMNMVSELTNVENSFTGKLPNEIVIDPIAVYTEL